MAYTDYLDRVQEIYIGYYQRPADPQGLLYWAAQLDANGGNLDSIINAFANSAESQALYGNITSANIDTVINNIYEALFGRAADATGLAYYHNGFVAGTFSPATIMLNILDGAQGTDLVTLENKVTAADEFTKTIDPNLDGRELQATYAGNADAQAARTWLAGVGLNPGSIPDQAETTEFIQTSIADPGDPILTSPTFVLTTSVDNIVGTAANDTIIGVFGGAPGSGNTFTVGDSINGGGGTNTLSLTAQGTDPSPGAVTVTNIQDVTVRDLVGATVNAVGFTGNPAISFYDTMTGNMSTVTNGALGSTMGLTGKGNLTVDYLNTTGKADTALISLAGAGTSATVLSTVDVSNTNTIEGVNVATSGTNYVNLAAGSKAATITVTGNGTNDINLLSAAATFTLDASPSTGTNTFGLGPVLATTDTIKGGTGADTVSADLTAATLINPTITGVETLSLEYDAAATLNLSKTTGATTLNLAGSTANQTITNAGSDLSTVNITSQGTTGNDLTLSYATGQTADLTMNIGNTTTKAAPIGLGNLTLNGLNGFNLNTVGTKANYVGNTAIKGNLSDLDITVGAGGYLSGSDTTVAGSIGEITMTVGSGGYFYSNDIYTTKEGENVGDITMTVASAGSGEAYAGAYSGGTVGNVTLDVGTAASGYLYTESYGYSGIAGNTGNVSATAAAGGSAYVDADAYSGSIGTVTVTATGRDSWASAYASAYGFSDAYTKNPVGAEAGGGNIGDVTITASGQNAFAEATASAYYGDVSSVTLNAQGAGAYAEAYVSAYDWGGAGKTAGASGDVGDVAITAGDNASAYTEIYASGSIGNFTVSLGTGASAYIDAYGYSGNVGTLTATMGDNSYLDAYFSATEGDATHNGDIGAATITAGNGDYIDYGASAFGSVGNLSITAGDDTYISAFAFAGSKGSIGTIDMTVGADGSIFGDFEAGGSIGDVTVTGGAGSYVSGSPGLFPPGTFPLGADGFILDAGTGVGNVSVTAGDDINLSVYTAGMVGAITLAGGAAGTTASAYVSGYSVSQVNATGYAGYAEIDLSGVTVGTTISVGGGGSDIIGTQSADNIFGGAGADLIDGGLGVNTTTGGGGADTFYFEDVDGVYTPGAAADATVTDIITDFTSGTDKLDFSTDAGNGTNFDAVTTAAASWTALTTAAGAALTGTGGVEYYFGVYNGNGYLFQDNSATAGDVTTVTQLDGTTNLKSADVIHT